MPGVRLDTLRTPHEHGYGIACFGVRYRWAGVHPGEHAAQGRRSASLLLFHPRCLNCRGRRGDSVLHTGPPKRGTPSMQWQHEVRQFRLAAVRPVPNVMAIDIVAVRAAGKATALVARLERMADRRRDAAGLASHIGRFSRLSFDDFDDAGVAGKPTRSVGGEGRPVFELAASG